MFINLYLPLIKFCLKIDSRSKRNKTHYRIKHRLNLDMRSAKQLSCLKRTNQGDQIGLL
jgi:hypothetical protein